MLFSFSVFTSCSQFCTSTKMMNVYFFVFGFLVSSSSAVRGLESRTRLKREAVFSDVETLIDTQKVAASRLDRNLDAQLMAPSKCKGKGGGKKGDAIKKVSCGGKGDDYDEETHGDDEDIPPYHDPPLGTDVHSKPTPAPPLRDPSGKDGEGDHTDYPHPTAAPTTFPTGNGIAGGADGEGVQSNATGNVTAAPSPAPSSSPTKATAAPSPAPSSSPTKATTVPTSATRVVSCDGADESALDLLTPKYVGYEYSVKTDGETDETGKKYTLTEVLDAIESAVLDALLDGNVLNCGGTRKLETDVHRRLDRELLRISSDPPDRPFNNVPVNCIEGEDCNVLIQGNLTVFVGAEADDEQALDVIECDIIILIQKLLMSMSLAEIWGLKNITYIGDPMCQTPGGASTSVTEETFTSDPVPAGLIIGAAVGGMCVVLMGLLVVRQRMSRRREADTTVDGSGMVKASSRSISVTVDQSDSHQTFDVTPTSTNLGGNTLGISASQDHSEWSGANERVSDVETGPERANMETSDDTISFGSATHPLSPLSPDPPSMESAESVHFEPTVKEEEHLTHDVRYESFFHKDQQVTH